MADKQENYQAKKRHIVLIVDDYEDTLALLRVFFEMRNCEVLEGRSGEEAVTLTQNHKPDLIILDLQLAGLDGVSALKEIRSIKTIKQPPVIITSGHTGNEYKKAAIDAGCNEYIVKPIEMDVLGKFLEKYLTF